MGTPRTPLPVTLFVAVLYREGFAVDETLRRLGGRFGGIASEYGPVAFTWTGYYAAEMGERLLKRYVCCGMLIDRDKLPSIKNFTNSMEQEYASGGGRAVNIDPGYIARDKLVLATTKDFYHRLYLGDGIYGEVTLHFQKGKFRHFSWTYPDFKEEGLLAFLVAARAGLAGEIRKRQPGERAVTLPPAARSPASPRP